VKIVINKLNDFKLITNEERDEFFYFFFYAFIVTLNWLKIDKVSKSNKEETERWPKEKR